jgi:hypothetical protein
MRLAEENLDLFWKTMDQNMLSSVKGSFQETAVWKLLSQERNLQRTLEWVEPAKPSKSVSGDGLAQPLSELYFELEHRTERTIGRTTAKNDRSAKQKTRGATAPVVENEEAVVPPSAEEDRRPTFTVDARALKVFRTLFYMLSVSATPGKVAWLGFLDAMSSVGFKMEKLHGSVWHFQPTKLGVERSIQIHEPHPVAKMAYRVARRVGRRLERAYGWFGNMFVLEESRRKE